MKYRQLLFAICMLLVVKSNVAAQYVLNGSATNLGGGCYQLTPNASGQTGNIFSQDPIDLTQPFSLNARMNFGNKDVNGADGIVFILHTTNSALGGAGGSLGYEGITPSIAIEYDDYVNGDKSDPNADHVGIISMGSANHSVPSSLVAPIILANIEDGEDHCFSVSWDPLTQTLLALFDQTSISYTGDIVNSIFSGNPIVYYGFSSGTGSLSNLHKVCFWEPPLVPMPDVTICEGETANLQADQNGIAWNWASHPTLSASNISNPAAATVTTTTYTVQIEYTCGYFHHDTVTVTVNPKPVAVAGNDGPVCPGENIQLTATGGGTYHWNGPAGFNSFSQNPVIPDITPPKTGTYTVTVTDAQGCTGVAQTEVELFTLVPVEIDPAPSPVCNNADPFQLTASPGGGTWEGEVTAEGVFDPADAGAGEYVITYTVTDNNGCIQGDEVTIEVLPVGPATILTPGPFCEDQSPIILMADPPGGVWGEDVEADGSFYPAGPGTYLVSYELTDAYECYHNLFFIEVLEAPDPIAPVLSPVCANDPPFQLTGFSPVGGTWGGAANPTGMVDPSTLGPGTHSISYTVTAGTCPEQTVSATLDIFAVPSVESPTFNCDGTGAVYAVSFTISGGDPSSYTVTGSVPGSLIPSTPAVFTSQFMPSGSSYTFQVYDQYGCDTLVVSGAYACNCMTQAGNPLDTTAIVLCEGETAYFEEMYGFTLDDNDTLIYVLHTGDPFQYVSIGDTLRKSVNPVSYFIKFPFQSPLETGITYQVSVLIGNKTGADSVDLNDPCLVIAPGPTIFWKPLPTGSISGPGTICYGDTAEIIVTLDGTGPYSITLVENGYTFDFDSVFSGFAWHVAPFLDTQQYLMFNITDLGTGCIRWAPDSASIIYIAVSDVIPVQQGMAICAGDSILLGGVFQFSPGVYYDTLPGNIGCDTLLETILIVHTPDTTFVSGTTCDPGETGIFIDMHTGAEGCDSIVIETVSLLPADTTYLFSSSCIPSDSGTTITVLQNLLGCDSILMEYTALISSWSTSDTTTTCDPNAAGTMTELLISSQGCDSMVTHITLLLPSDSIVLTSATCEPADTGHVTYHFTNANGCDSLVTEITVLYPPDTCIVIAHEIFIPNIFSPNDDGVNDRFFVMGHISNVRLISFMRLYDRWGNLVFDEKSMLPNDPSLGWDGRFRGMELNPAVFVYVLEVEYQDGQKEMRTGNVTLVR